MDKYAIFFPQFHRVKVNDDAWGAGFTDWALVASANAFDSWERRAPAGGFYDLNNSNEVQKQFQDAASRGLDGFGIYHYRFEDGPELTAVERYLEDAQLPDGFGYFFIWANENWSKRWAGRDTELLKTVATEPTRDQICEHVDYLKPFMESKSYRRVGGKPLFVIYRPDFFVDPASSLAMYREEFKSAGVDVALGYFIIGPSDVEYSNYFDFCYLFEPRLFFRFNSIGRSKLVTFVFRWLTHMISYSHLESLSEFVRKVTGRKSASYEFAEFLGYLNSTVRASLIESISCPVQNVLACGWNNAPRYRDRFTALTAPSPNLFQQMLSIAVADKRMSDEFPLMCNAWNEWSEGAAIEPCAYLGDEFVRVYGAK